MSLRWHPLAILALIAPLSACAIGDRAPPPRPPAPLMPSSALDHQDPGADLSKNKVISRSTARYNRGPSVRGSNGSSNPVEALATIGFALAGIPVN